MRLVLIAAAVLAVLGGAFWLLQDDDAGAAEPSLAPLGESLAVTPAMDLGSADAGASDGPAVITPLAAVEHRDLLAVEPASSGLLADARVAGLLLDERGQPVAGEQVDLFVQSDAWEPGAQWPAPDDEPGSTPLSRARSDGDGRFSLAARPGARHVLRAGGRRHPRTTVHDVHAGDELSIDLQAPRTLVGQVFEAETGAVVAGAWVSARGEHAHQLTRADDEGVFAITPLPAEALTVVAWSPGHELAVLKEQVPGFDEPVLELPPGRELVGRVIDRVTEEPVVGAQVRYVLDTDVRLQSVADPLQTALEVYELTAETDELGSYRIDDAISWGFRVEIEAEGYVPESVDRHRLKPLKPGHELVTRLRPRLPVVIDVQAEGAPVAGARTWVRETAGAVLADGFSDEDGLVELELEAWEGRERLWVRGTDDQGRSGRAFVGKDVHLPVSLELFPTYELQVRAVREGEVVPGAQVAVLGQHGMVWTAGTGADGVASFVITMSSAMEVLRIQARHGGRQSLENTYLLALDGQTPQLRDTLDATVYEGPVDLELDAGAYLRGQVVDTWGQPVAGARIASHGHTDAEGRFELGPLREVDQRMAVFAEGHRKGLIEATPPDDEVLVVLEPVITWEGRVLDASSGLPAERFEGLLEREVQSDEGFAWKPIKSKVERGVVPGEWTVALPEAGRYRVRLLVPDHLPAFSDVVDFDGINAPPFADVVSSPAAVLVVLLLDTTGMPVPGVDLQLAAWARASQFDRPTGRATRGAVRRRTDTAGRARFDLGQGGSYRLANKAEWIGPGRLDVLPGPAREQIVRIPATGSLIVRVLDDTGAPQAAKVTAKSVGKPAYQVRRVVRTDPKAAPEGAPIERLPPGTYELSVSLRDHHAPAEQVLVIAARTSHVDVLASPGGVKVQKAKGGKGKNVNNADGKKVVNVKRDR